MAYLVKNDLDAELQASACASAELFVELKPVPLRLSVAEKPEDGAV